MSVSSTKVPGAVAAQLRRNALFERGDADSSHARTQFGNDRHRDKHQQLRDALDDPPGGDEQGLSMHAQARFCQLTGRQLGLAGK